MRYGYPLMTEQSGPRQIVQHAAGGERAGFDFERAGFTDVAVVQIGDESQADFLDFAEKELLPALRSS